MSTISGPSWGVKQVEVLTGRKRWFTNERHSRAAAVVLAKFYNKPGKGEEFVTDLEGKRVRFEAALIGKDDEY